MTFSDEIVKKITDRSTLVRINPGRFFDASDLVSEGSGVYSANLLGFDVSVVARNSVDMTAVTLDPPTVNDTYFYNETTGRLVFKVASAPNSTSNIIVVSYYIYYTSGTETDHYRTPDVQSGPKVFWKPYVLGSSNFVSSIDGLEAGIVSISDASVDIANEGNDFAKYTTANDSFFNRNIEIWHSVNGFFNKVYSGSVTSIPTIDESIVSIAFSDQLSLLNATAYMRDSFENSFHVSSNIPAKDLFKPIPIIWAEQSFFEADVFTGSDGLTEITTKNGLSAVCTNYTTTINTSNNREWTLCRSPNQISTHTFGDIEETTTVGGTAHFRFSSVNTQRLFVGDSISWVESSVTYYGIVVFIGNYTYSSVTYNVRCKNQVGSVSTSTSSEMIELLPVSVIVKQSDGTNRFPINGRDYTVSSVTTAAPIHMIKIAFNAGAESDFFSETLDPSIHDVQFKLCTQENQDSLRHSLVLSQIISFAGVKRDFASFEAAVSIHGTNASFSIPLKGELEYSSYLFYVQRFLESMLAYLRQNSSNRITYHYIDAPSGTTTRDEGNIIASSLSKSIEYRDLITELVTKNDHLPVFGTADVSGTSQSLKAIHLHGIKKSFTLNHILQANPDGSIPRQAEILAARSNPRSEISYSTETLDFQTIIGDEQTINTDIVHGSTEEIFITSVSKSEKSTKVTGTDLQGL